MSQSILETVYKSLVDKHPIFSHDRVVWQSEHPVKEETAENGEYGLKDHKRILRTRTKNILETKLREALVTSLINYTGGVLDYRQRRETSQRNPLLLGFMRGPLLDLMYLFISLFFNDSYTVTYGFCNFLFEMYCLTS